MRKFIVIATLATVVVIGAVVFIVQPVWLFARFGRPEESVIRSSGKKKFDRFVRGEPLVSKGAFGPEGTIVYPIKFEYREFRMNYDGTSDYPVRTEELYFWKDPYGQWQHADPLSIGGKNIFR